MRHALPLVLFFASATAIAQGVPSRTASSRTAPPTGSHVAGAPSASQSGSSTILTVPAPPDVDRPDAGPAAAAQAGARVVAGGDHVPAGAFDRPEDGRGPGRPGRSADADRARAVSPDHHGGRAVRPPAHHGGHESAAARQRDRRRRHADGLPSSIRPAAASSSRRTSSTSRSSTRSASTSSARTPRICRSTTRSARSRWASPIRSSSVVTAEREAEINRVGLRVALEQRGDRRTKAARSARPTGSTSCAPSRTRPTRGPRSSPATRRSAKRARRSVSPSASRRRRASPPTWTSTGLARSAMESCRAVTDVDDRADIASARVKLDVAKRNLRNVWYTFLPTVTAQSTLTGTSRHGARLPNPTWNIHGDPAGPDLGRRDALRQPAQRPRRRGHRRPEARVAAAPGDHPGRAGAAAARRRRGLRQGRARAARSRGAERPDDAARLPEPARARASSS